VSKFRFTEMAKNLNNPAPSESLSVLKPGAGPGRADRPGRPAALAAVVVAPPPLPPSLLCPRSAPKELPA
jgi:hypothetical protein